MPIKIRGKNLTLITLWTSPVCPLNCVQGLDVVGLNMYIDTKGEIRALARDGAEEFREFDELEFEEMVDPGEVVEAGLGGELSTMGLWRNDWRGLAVGGIWGSGGGRSEGGGLARGESGVSDGIVGSAGVGLSIWTEERGVVTPARGVYEKPPGTAAPFGGAELLNWRELLGLP